MLVGVESRHKTAVATPYGLFQFRVMPFSLHGALSIFQRMMDCLLWDISNFAAAYLDDIVIHSQTCQFAMLKCSYLGEVQEKKEKLTQKRQKSRP